MPRYVIVWFCIAMAAIGILSLSRHLSDGSIREVLILIVTMCGTALAFFLMVLGVNKIGARRSRGIRRDWPDALVIEQVSRTADTTAAFDALGIAPERSAHFFPLAIGVSEEGVTIRKSPSVRGEVVFIGSEYIARVSMQVRDLPMAPSRSVLTLTVRAVNGDIDLPFCVLNPKTFGASPLDPSQLRTLITRVCEKLGVRDP